MDKKYQVPERSIDSAALWGQPSNVRGLRQSGERDSMIYSDGLKLRMPHPFRSRCPKECRRGGKILKNTGKMQFSGTCNLTGSFFNESFVGKFCESLQRNMRLSATRRMPPAKKSRSQHVKNLKPIFSKYSVYAGFYVLCAAHIECRQKQIQMSSFCCKISVFFNETHGLKDCINLLFHMNNCI